MATAKMKIILPLVVWTWLHFITPTTGQSFGGIGFGIKREIFFLNLEDGYFGCQVNESTDVLQLYELSKLCDGTPNCYLGSDELAKELKCTDDCRKDDGTECQNGACLDNLCYCNDGYGGCSCEVPDENECKYRPCDVFAHCTNTLGSFSCTCFPGYHGDGFHCEDIDECDDPAIAARCVENAECCNLPAHFLCKCKPGFQGDGEVQCLDIDECQQPNACGQNALCQNTPGNYTCLCPEGFYGNPFDGCVDVDECEHLGACGPGATCANVVGGRQCHCPPGYEGDPYTTGCIDSNECARNPCGRNALCSNLEGSFRCACPPGYIGDPMFECSAAECNNDLDCSDEKACLNFQCVNPCNLRGACGENAHCKTIQHRPRCSCPECYVGTANTACHPDPNCLKTHPRPAGQVVCFTDSDCDPKSACNINTGKCYDPCQNQAIRCRDNKKCEVHYHKPTCVCKKGFMVNERGEIACAPDRSECSNDSECPNTKACIEQLCQNPCTASPQAPCPPEKGCDVLNHKPTCICLKNCSPSLSICLRDNGCPTDQACRAFRCENPCNTANCPENTPCTVEDHKPICEYCPPGYKQDPKYGCFKDVQCRSHSDCAPQQACVNRKCQNPCLVSNPCTNSQDCQVQDHQPVCVKVCQCQGDRDCAHLGQRCDGCNCVVEARNPQCAHCPPGVPCDPLTNACLKEPPSERAPKPCESDMDCLESEACYMSLCQDPCEFTSACAEGARCQAKMHRPICTCPMGFEGNPAIKCSKSPTMGCTTNEECPISEACIDRACQRPCDVHNPCAQHAVCINTNHGCDCSCEEGFQGNGFVGCAPVSDYGPPVCQYNEDCPPNKLCDRLNRRCINPCFEDSCGDNAECIPKNHEATCICLPGYEGNAYVECLGVFGCRHDEECPTNEACINQQCTSPCNCGINAICDVIYHKPQCKCPPGYQGDARVSCQPPTDPCDPNPCGTNALCELDNGNPICFCPKGLTGNPFKNCIPEGDECSPNPCGPNSGCRVVGGNAVCFCLPEYEGTPPQIPCSLPSNPCDPSPCGPNTQCSILPNGFAKCTCLTGFLESPNTIRGCVEAKNPCEPNPCGPGALCDPHGEPVCYCPYGTSGNPFRSCVGAVEKPLCSPGPCGINADCYNTNNEEQCYCRSGFIGDPYTACRIQPPSPCVPNPCGPGAQCVITPDGNSMCRCPEGMGGDPTGPLGCFGYECVVDENCGDHQACISYRCRDPCPGSCGLNADCRVEKHHPVCTCQHGLTGNPIIRCFPVPVVLPPHDPCMPNPCGVNTICQAVSNRAVCSCLPEFYGDPQIGCHPECLINSDCPINKACLDRHCKDPCAQGHLCGVNAICQVRDHTASCTCIEGFMGDPFLQCIHTPTVVIPTYPNVTTQPCTPSPCGNMECSIYGTQIAICDPCLGPEAAYNPQCRPECLINSDCSFHHSCLRFNCIDPCPGSCGANAICTVVSHTPICSCPSGLVGDPFQQCIVPAVAEPTPKDTCEYQRCGVNADCLERHTGIVCVCRKGFFGDPYLACRPECVINPDCPLDKACINAKCANPCTDVCGVGAQCDVVNHIPICYCPPQHTGDPFVACYKVVIPSQPQLPPQNPCDPSPCGPFSRCLVSHQGYATCSCLPNYQGVAPACKPECISTSECPQTRACINQKCADPCPGTCGSGALCTVINHNPLCSCSPGLEGNPFVNCHRPAVVEEKTPATTPEPRNPCAPSPCGPNSICQVKENRPVCSCVANYVGSPPYCRPECVISQDCSQHEACVNEKCVDPCIGTCGPNAKCSVVNHTPFCSCSSGYEGDAFVACTRVVIEERPKDPCNPSPCGENAQCSVSGGVAKCTCIPPYIGNPYSGGCRPECTMNSECPTHLACLSLHCRDPCQGLCGINAECSVFNHIPVCTCARGLTGDPQTACREPPVAEKPRPCEPSPCGPNSVCRERNDQAICSCQVGYFGQPPSCRPECLVSSMCNADKACINQKCEDPCPGTCGANARCQVTNHNPICSCPPNFVGDPFIVCRQEERKPEPAPTPCIPSPCGANADCQSVNNRAICTCLPGMFGAPPNCRPECSIDQDCPLTLACTNQKCRDPCVGSCGFNAECSVVNHRPICSCQPGFEGDPFSGCSPVPVIEQPRNPCNPSPCGSNAICKERNGAGSCICVEGYFGDPYSGCRPECVTSSECSHDKACLNMKCKDPCPGTCGVNAECSVINHNPQCYCIPGYTGNALSICRKIEAIVIEEPKRNPCVPSPCGPYSVCQIVNERPVCSCAAGYYGAPPMCKPECVVNSECTQDKSCHNQICVDPCPGTCGLNALCRVLNHSPICSCPPSYMGDPFIRCLPEQKRPVEVEKPNPCIPSPCGTFSECKIISDRAVCSCLPNYFGQPPNCKPECVINSECSSNRACVNQKCRDPCPGACGANAQCSVVNHLPVCYCYDRFTGDPFSGCQELLPVEEPAQPCNPSPCGSNANCKELNGAGSCTCVPGYFGDPYTACRPECVQNSECPRDKSCINNKCKNPCRGSCGINAECIVNNHVPNCDCLPGFTGNPTLSCHTIVIQTPEEPKNPCLPSPCGPFSQCREVNGHAVCSCQQNYIGAPPMCKPECIVSSECAQDKACINQKCKDPCPGTCGLNALCHVINHNPICSCAPRLVGDPFVRCIQEEKRPVIVEPGNPCVPTPCGQNSQCRVIGVQAVCSCLPNYIGRAPNCRPECTINQECPGNLACVNERCKDPCPGSCGFNAECVVTNHSPHCQCQVGFTGDPFNGCIPIPIAPVEEERNPCNPSPCGANAECRERNGAGSCVCVPEYFGDPYTGCRPECITNTDCARDKACLNNKCKDPCPGICGINAECRVSNHVPSCFCFDGYTGNPSVSCHLPPPIAEEPKVEPCNPSPCGPYSACRVINEHAVCSCQANYIGSPPMCRPECMISAECSLDKTCINSRCQDPCPGTCGINARCQVVNHNPICSCTPGYTGDPFIRCLQEERKPAEPLPPANPCVPSPCGPNSNCRVIGNTPACSCIQNFVGRPPNCRPECTINAECAAKLACQNERCVDPCPGSCGANTECMVISHRPVCSCRAGHTGDPFSGCIVIPIAQPIEEERNPCNPSPCGANAECRERNGAGSCVCLPEYLGDPYTGCRPECVTNSDCPRDRACVNNKCKDPCPGTCGINAECSVPNHAPSCVCLPGYTGNPFTSCHLPPPIVVEEPKRDPCVPSPCGPYSACKNINNHAVCSCQPEYVGSPPACRPECMVSSECSQNQACINQKCKDPCPGTCGINARCQVVNHNPICSCSENYVGDPFVRCVLQPKKPIEVPSGNPCVPSPCGPNSQCRVVGTQAACSCLPNYIGRAPNCRPECTINSECPGNLACQNERCKDPCPGSCGSFTSCIVIKHAPVCQCVSGYTGDPFTGCSIIPPSPPVTEQPRNPCNPSPCGANAICKERIGAGSCACLPEYFGDPYTGCRPECVANSDCDRSRSCVNNKCVDPCPGTCGLNSECNVINHTPSCTCIPGYTGDPTRACNLIVEAIVEEPQNPCQPSPCGPYSACREVNGHAVCSCNIGYVGSPPMCRPECVVSSECPQNNACVSQKCVDPCPGTCGLNAQCRVVNHNPICSCLTGFTGDPFIQCSKVQLPPPPKTPENPCLPTPCGPNSQCRVVGNQAACSCLQNFVGRPPNCRPECSSDSECPNHLACTNEKCKDPCPGLCEINAQCTVVNHKAICSCFPGYTGDPSSSCNLPPPPPLTERPRTPCSPSPCGPNAECREKNGAGACYCAAGYEGNAYDSERGCRRECEVNNDCSPALACVSFKCVDPCPGTCGTLAECHVNNHIPTCICPTGYTGDPFFQCRIAPTEPPPIINPCQPSPCGPNSQCREVNNQAVCSCLPQYIGSPPNCRPECIVNSECQLDKACTNQKCGDPCPNTCGLFAQCTTKNHNPICACPPGYTGDPFTRCSPNPLPPPEPSTERPPSCQPSPCGPNSICKIIGSSPTCSCLPNYIGAPPNCRPECVLSSECGSSLACINQKCKDPCPGSCGSNTVCTVLNHIPICTCQEGFTGDAFTNCYVIPPSTKAPETDPCNPSPCGPNAQCNNGICTCLPEYIGNPFEACRPECVLSAECTRDKACIRNKCVDPCPGTCGQNARCDVINHIPTCSCPDGYTGDPFINCRVSEPPPPKPNPCNPSPCGPNSQCREINDQAVCSCLAGYQGSPPGCRPECVVNAECPQNRACINQKCIDPCPGSCGARARCEVRNHSPICSCAEGETGDPFQGCRPIPPEPVTRRPIITEPCNPSPCGPNSICRPAGESYACSCLPDYIGNPPNCRPECVINTDCPSTQACINNKCKDPCPGSCGENAECHVISHTVTCTCLPGFVGDPFVQCIIKTEPIKPCEPSPCGANAECRERNGAGACICLPDYQGNPYEGCRPECVLSSDCQPNKACIMNKCADPCPGVCGQNAECAVLNHVPTCTCILDFTGDAFRFCNPLPPEPVTEEPTPRNPCVPSPCGPNSQCREVNGQAVCSCLPEYQGSPPSCKPECVVSSECPSNRACHKFKCANPCVGTCGIGARCEVINHNPICSCPSGLTGDAFTRCYELPVEPKPAPPTPRNPCVPSPCGPNSECRDIGGQPSCSCRATYIGVAPNCRPECVVNTDCPSHLACITEKCKDPCPGSCGFNAECRVHNHIPICVCAPGFVGNAFTECLKEQPKIPVPEDPCNPSPCGQNAQCDNGICTCLPLYQGDPYRGCRPECTMNTDCSPTKTCINLKCVDPCPGTCGQGAICDVVNHLPICSCPAEFEGNPFVSCRLKPRIPPPVVNPCQPSPCGPNSVCKVNNGVAVCSCQPGMIGSAPQCRPECVVSSECPLTQACLNNKCIDPCPGTCGLNALCQVVNHNPICSCSSGNTGDPFTRCFPIPPPPPQENAQPCQPSPCGPNSVCQVRGASPACSCLEGYVGVPPSCRPECTINPECPSARACINQKCRDPCPGSCGANAVCSVVNHNPACTCSPGHTGDPFRGCVPTPPPPSPPPKPREDPCYPSPCGPNARCRTENNYAICECLPEYHGNPYEGCRPECLSNSDCPSNTACIRSKCQDPCPGTCGVNALCTVTNHVPVCTCQQGYTGDAFRYCSFVVVEPPKDPCNPSPCGLNTICRTVGKSAVCECVPGFFGNANLGGCRPECTISSDCARDKACVNTKCVDPCPGVCGFKAVCNVINHSPVCSCPQPLVGDPFTLCAEPVIEEPQDPCNPSPCRANGQCRVVNGAATCIYPECVINPDCPRDKACYFQKCQDPCRDACGLNALCQVVNHQAVCSCPPGYVGTPEVQCRYLPPEQPKPKVECTQDSDCTNDKACINSRCQNPCSTASCGQNAECRPQLHRAICICRDGFTGNAQHACVEIGCRSDSDCAPIHACVNRECVDPCSYTSCGINALCRVDGNHKARCYCPESFRGNPLVQCERPECTRDEECPYNLACRNERCQDPCNCGPNAICNVINHRAQCSCPPGYVGNPLASCRIEERRPQPQCKMDSDCPSKLACFGGLCKNPCIETKPCGKNAECIVVDSLPLRTMSCMCLPGYVGDADVDCRLAPQEEPGCKSNQDCSQSEACINRQCVNPCVIGNPCESTAECQATNHKALCKCPTPLIGDPFIRCYEQPRQPKPECVHDGECPNDKSCINQRCQDPCALSNQCGTNAECQTRVHRPICVCPYGWVGNPQVMCYKPECKADGDCPYNKACISKNCLNPCASTSCGRGAECVAQNHRAQCQCPAGTQGDPLLSCITGQCQYNEDCADHEACDRLNRVCRPVCDDETCAVTAQCIGQNHQPKCHCPIGTTGNPFIECKLPVQPICTIDADCPSQLGCINELCLNPCHQGDMCSIEQECRVIDTLPVRTVMCACPPDQILDNSGHCRAIVREKPQCQQDTDCADAEKCHRGSCVDACRLDSCGVNAICRATHHLTQCTCAPGYTGNPRLECTNIPRVTYLPQPECTRDDECPLDKACRNDMCLNPCRSDKPCGTNAFCSVNRHQAICRCPEGYIGRPEIECLAPPTAPAIGCTTNSECPLSEFCLNKLCISPCNCGPNADCKVDHHYATCFCKAGYSGNPQTGCVKLGCQSDSECADDQQCYNTQCINPCILGDPCARNAECFGRNHKASCRCPPSFNGDPFVRCERLECYSNQDCPSNRACLQNRCVDPCSPIANPPCAQNAECYAQNHAASCVCPEHLPEGNPLAYCYPRTAIDKPVCVYDSDCPSKLACIRNQCVNPCEAIAPCHPTASCSVIDTTPVRTMACTCREGWVPNDNGECYAILIPIPPGCSKDDDCPTTEACINRICRNPCDCGINAICDIRNHKPICSCKEGFEGNPNIACRTIGCRINSECDSGTACINGQCVSPCLVKNPCGTNAECFVNQNNPECRCRSGYRGNPYERCLVVGCVSNSECPGDRQCINAQCINPCLYDNPCSPRAECLVQNHMALCKCPPGFIGNPFVDCKPEPQPECREDGDCPERLACINSKCQNPCTVIQPCQNPAKCQVVSSLPVRTMNCVCPPGYISSGSGTCKPVTAIVKAACSSDSECPSDRACFNGICRNPCNCGPNAECRIKDHKPICACLPDYEGNPEISCRTLGCRHDDECSPQHTCVNRQCVPVCLPDGKPCGQNATCYGNHHRAICECPPGRLGNPRVGCVLVGCRSDSECPSTTACINNECENQCVKANPCEAPAECKIFNHITECICPPGTVSDGGMGCLKPETACTLDHDCQSGLACIGNECVNPCASTEPCGINTVCKVVDTEPVRTMICECLPGYHGNAAVKCDRVPSIAIDCNVEKGYVRTPSGECICPPNTALNENDYCVPCPVEKGLVIDERGRCVCALEKGLIIDERGNCVCPIEFGYRLDAKGNCVPVKGPDCETDDDCPDHKYCNPNTKTCDNPCATKRCGVYALCNATNHQAICQCIAGYSGNPDKYCNSTSVYRTDFPKPEMVVSCLSDGVQVEILINEQEGFNGVLYVKGHSKDEQCRRVLTLPPNSAFRTELFKVQFGNCGLIHVNGKASFVLVIQKHPKLVTYKAQAYHIQCVYQTGEQNVTLGFNVSMLTTAGTIANTGPPPTCLMKIVTPTGQEINSAEIGDSLILQVDVQPGSIYGGFARSCVAKTMEDSIENEYLVTDENGCATDPSIFGEWEYNPDTQSLLATFHAFKFPSSDNIRFQCNIRVCFGKCQPVNCRGSDAFGRRRRAVTEENEMNDSDNLLSGQLREEITIQSNAILTLERREERYTDTSLSPDAQRAEDICVSMIGFIIALIITALLALVAVAVAVSCWLMAYRRRPKSTGPLPHPPEFPNPLFTTPEPMAEPSPDYLT